MALCTYNNDNKNSSIKNYFVQKFVPFFIYIKHYHLLSSLYYKDTFTAALSNLLDYLVVTAKVQFLC